MSGTTVSVDRVITAPASAIFAIVADAAPSRDRRVRVGGQGEGRAPDQLRLGSVFGMSMKLGVPYSMRNTVIEFEPDRRIAWQTRLAGPSRALLGRAHLALRVRGDGERDQGHGELGHLPGQAGFLLRNGKVAQQFAATMSKTLDKLAALTESPARS